MKQQKLCTSCGSYRHISCFTKYKNGKDGLDFYCRSCKSNKNSIYYQKIRHERKKLRDEIIAENKLNKEKAKIYINNIKSVGCSICGEKELCCLDFHHKNHEDKLFDISDAKCIDDKLFTELEKCILVCRNCHRKIHAKIIICP